MIGFTQPMTGKSLQQLTAVMLKPLCKPAFILVMTSNQPLLRMTRMTRMKMKKTWKKIPSPQILSVPQYSAFLKRTIPSPTRVKDQFALALPLPLQVLHLLDPLVDLGTSQLPPHIHSLKCLRLANSPSPLVLITIIALFLHRHLQEICL